MLLSVQIPDDLNAELVETVKLGYPELNKSDVVRECLRRAIPSIKKSFIGGKQSTVKKKTQELNKRP